MQVDIPYGPETLRAELPDDTVTISNTAARALEPLDDLPAAVRAALAEPLDSPRLDQLARPGARVTIAFDDPTVPCFGPVRGPTIEVVLEELESAGVKREDVTLVCANALHRKFRPQELAHILGDDLVREFGPRLVCHDAEDGDELVYLGKTQSGYDVELNRRVVESDLTVYVNSGYNRGFSGGWKSICVGLSTYRSIRHHHTPDGMSMSISRNRMHEMLNEMGKVVEAKVPGAIFKVDTVMADPQQAARVFAGSVWKTREAVLEVQRGLFPPRRELSVERFDVVVYGVPNWSPYVVFSSMNPLLTLVSSGLGYLGGTVQAVGKPGCSVVMVTPCPDQWDRVHHASYPDVWQNVLSQTRDAYEIQRRFADAYAERADLVDKYRHAFAFHPVHAILATYPLRRLEHVGHVFVAGGQDAEVVRHVGFEPTATVEEALARAAELHGKDCRVAYVEQPAAPTKLVA
ncbi:MAG: lactate racemase domain-containing protein [Pirellulales bacterium]